MRFSAGFVVLLAASWVSHGVCSAQGPLAKTNDKLAGPVLVPATTERLTFDAEWRLIHAGTVTVSTQNTHADLKMESAGMVASLFKVHDTYSADFDNGFCATSTVMDSLEGKRHHEAKATFDRTRNHATYLERDLIKDIVIHMNEVDTPNCVHEVIGALLAMRGMPLEPGRSVEVPVSDGRKSALVKIEAQEREEVKTALGAFKTVRVEAFLLNGVIYTRKGRLQLWVTDDARHLPVQIRLRMNFPVGTVTLGLVKEEHL